MLRCTRVVSELEITHELLLSITTINDHEFTKSRRTVVQKTIWRWKSPQL
jgi:hypothetical protein